MSVPKLRDERLLPLVSIKRVLLYCLVKQNPNLKPGFNVALRNGLVRILCYKGTIHLNFRGEMTKLRFTSTRLSAGFSSLVAVILAACVPATSTVLHPPSQTVAPSIVSTSTQVAQVTPSVDLTATYTLEPLSATPPSDVQPVATSRGANLEATDPTAVNLASGGLQLVEFFRFT